MEQHFCVDCSQGIMFPPERGPYPKRCPKHQMEHRAKLTKARVQRLRERQRVKRDKHRSFVIHLRLSPDGPTCCGAQQDTMAVGEWFFTHRGEPWHYCKKCAPIWEKAKQRILP